MTTIADIKDAESETGWKPTAYLRFGISQFEEYDPFYDPAKVLQQLWICSDGRDEWRDVPFRPRT